MKTLTILSFLSAALMFAPIHSVSAEGNTYITAENTISAEDDAELRQVIARLNHALDAADYTMYGSFFAEDGVFVSDFGNAIGPEAIATALEQVAPFIINKRHIAANLVISGSGDDAVVTSYLIVFEREKNLSFVGSAVNVDIMKRRNRVWQVARHSSTLDPATAKAIQSQMQHQ